MGRFKVNFGVVAVAALLFMVISAFVAISTRVMMEREAHKTVENAVNAAVAETDGLIVGVESAVGNSAWLVEHWLPNPSALPRICHELVSNNRFIVGSAVAFTPSFYPSVGRLYAPYSSRAVDGSVRDAQLNYDYSEPIPRNDWFCEAMRRGAAYWCEPYFDEGGGDISMSTFSMPVHDWSNRMVAVLTADVSLADLSKRVSEIRPYSGTHTVLKSRRGRYLVDPPVMDSEKRANYLTMTGMAMNGWTVELMCPLSDILSGTNMLVKRVIMFSLLGLALMLFVSWSFSTRLQRVTVAAQRVESELSIAHAIQTGMVNGNLPSWAAALMVPAKEVGGDRYDFAEKGDYLYFGIGDASGKGVSAALYTAQVGAGFRIGVELGLEPAEMVGAVNRVIAKDNDNSMFVTGFAARLERSTGRMQYCNAGHNPPLVVSPAGEVSELPLRRNLVMGAMDDYRYVGEETTLPHGAKIITYTDGVTEAMSVGGEQYGMERMKALVAAHAQDEPAALVAALMKSVSEFAGKAPQSDDITVLAIVI